MANQAKISAFFNKKPPVKRAAEDDEKPAASKTQKVEEKDGESSSGGGEEQEEMAPKSPTAGKVPENNNLSPEQRLRMEVKRLEAEKKREKLKNAPGNMGSSWKVALSAEFGKEYFKQLQDFVKNERTKKTIYPPENEVFTWTQMCDINQIKVVIIGQDPYHGPKQAHGLCFSVQPGVAIPPSLQNMYKELIQDIPGFKHPGHGYLIGWAKQGVLLLNACLTVVAHQANSHQGKGWEKFTDAVIRWLNSNVPNMVFMLWGAYAQKKCSFIDKKKHCILKAVHPSPLSAHRGFFGSKHFSQANEYLKKNGRKVIDWSYLPLEIKE